MKELFAEFDSFIKASKFKYEVNMPSFQGEIEELITDNAGICKKKNSTMKYYVEPDLFREYCKKKVFCF